MAQNRKADNGDEWRLSYSGLMNDNDNNDDDDDDDNDDDNDIECLKYFSDGWSRMEGGSTLDSMLFEQLSKYSKYIPK